MAIIASLYCTSDISTSDHVNTSAVLSEAPLIIAAKHKKIKSVQPANCCLLKDKQL